MIYSDRPIMVMAQELCVGLLSRISSIAHTLGSVGWKRAPVLMPSLDPRFSRYRKLFHTALRKERVRELAVLQERSSATMLKLILNTPDDFVKHIR
jgi:hypothetical protein